MRVLGFGHGSARGYGERQTTMAFKILVVEDHPPTAKLVQVALQEQGYRVLTASNGAEGLLAVNAEAPDLVILDVMMPVMDGFDMLRVMRAAPQTRELPVVILTAKSADEDVLRGWATGVSSYLTKPFAIDDLIAMVRRILAAQPPPAGEQPR